MNCVRCFGDVCSQCTEEETYVCSRCQVEDVSQRVVFFLNGEEVPSKANNSFTLQCNEPGLFTITTKIQERKPSKEEKRRSIEGRLLRRQQKYERLATFYESKLIKPEDLLLFFPFPEQQLSYSSSYGSPSTIRNEAVARSVKYMCEQLDVAEFAKLPTCYQWEDAEALVSYCFSYWEFMNNEKEPGMFKEVLLLLGDLNINVLFMLIHSFKEEAVLALRLISNDLPEDVIRRLVKRSLSCCDEIMFCALKEVGLLTPDSIGEMERVTIFHGYNIPSLEFLLENGFDIESENSYGETLLTCCAAASMGCVIRGCKRCNIISQSVLLVEYLVRKGASLNNLLFDINEEIIPEVLETLVKVGFDVHSIPVQRLFPREGNGNYLIMKRLKKYDYKIPTKFINKMLKKATKHPHQNTRWKSGNYEKCSDSLVFVMQLLSFGYLKLDDLNDTLKEAITEGMVDCDTLIVNSSTLPLLPKTKKAEMIMFLLCVRRIERIIGKLLGSDIKITLLSRVFSKHIK